MLPADPFALVRPWLDSLARGLIIFSGEVATYANPRAQSWVGSDVLGTSLGDLPHLLEGRGFLPDRTRTARWGRGEEALELSVDSNPAGGVLAWLDEVRQSSAQRLKFLSVACHDIRGALANIRSFGGLLLLPKWKLEGKVRSGLEVVVRNADRATALTTEVFDSLRSELFPLDVDIHEGPLAPVLEEVLTRARRSAAEHEIGMDVELPPALPDWPTDVGRLTHTLDALLAHALERTPPHGACRVEVTSGPDHFAVAVEDGGTAHEPLDTLFARDVRVERASKLEGGFRLSLARAEAQALGGSLAAQALPSGALRLTLAFDRSAAGVVAGPPLF